MAISQRLRYEILRRDGNRCRYCGTTVEHGARLTVDHVIPVTLGGSDDPTNLVAACADCNTGKSSAQPDAAFVDDVREDALLWRQLTEAAAAQLHADRDAEQAFITAGYDLWEQYCGRWKAPTSAENSLHQMYLAGATTDDLSYAAQATQLTTGVTYHWAYFCGIIWRHIRARDDLAQRMYEQHQRGQ